MIQITRRRFLRIILTAAVGAGAIGIVAVRFSYSALRERYYRLSADIPSGPISGQILRTLIAVTDALIGAPFERGHYEDFLSWHAATISGYRGLYERMAAELDRSGMALAQKPFADLDFEKRRRIVNELLQWQGHRFYKLWTGVFSRDRLYFDRYIAQPVLELYARTDAWIHLGYEAWPGRPRGLDRYMRPPGEGANTGARRQEA